jgi:hypothetical protein
VGIEYGGARAPPPRSSELAPPLRSSELAQELEGGVHAKLCYLKNLKHVLDVFGGELPLSYIKVDTL